MTEAETPVAIGLGSNLGDRLEHLRTGVAIMSRAVGEAEVSPVYSSPPQGVDPDQPDYLNAVLVGRTRLSPGELLDRAREAEAEAGRERPHPGAARTLDVDILLFGDQVVEGEELRIPHPRWKDRAFVLAPLSRVAPGWRDPEGEGTVADLWREREPRLSPVREVAPGSTLMEGAHP